MNIAAFSIKRPIFIASLVILMLATGYVSLKRIGVDLFPDVNIPFITITTTYQGAGPEEIETLISKKIEEEVASISGLKRVSSDNMEGVSLVMCEFYLGQDIKEAEQQVRNKLGRVRRDLPEGINEPLIQRFDPADQPIVRLSIAADMPPAKLYDYVDQRIKPRFEQIPSVGAVRISGGQKREIQIEVDRRLLNQNQMTLTWIANNLRSYGANVPVGKKETGDKEIAFRTLGRFETMKQIENTVVSFGGDAGSALLLKRVAKVYDGVEDPKSKAALYLPVEEDPYDLNGKLIDQTKMVRERKPALLIDVYKQSNANTVAVADATLKLVEKINEDLRPPALKTLNELKERIRKGDKADKLAVHFKKIEDDPLAKSFPAIAAKLKALHDQVMKQPKANETGDLLRDLKAEIKKATGAPEMALIRDTARWIKINVEDVRESIIIGVLLAVIVVYLFLGNTRSTVITGLALPNSLLGAFILMLAMGFTINVITLLALSLSIGLLVDDAIVVRENIFRKMEEGEHPVKAAETGTQEVLLAVIATTMTVIAVFLPVGFLSGMVGQFLRQLGMTVVFAMAISLFDAITVAPMLSAYFGGHVHEKPNILIRNFNKFQDWLEATYASIMRFTLRRPLVTVGISLLVMVVNCGSCFTVKKTFLPPNTQPEFLVNFEMPPGTSLEGSRKMADEIENRLRKMPEVHLIASVAGSNYTAVANKGELGVVLVDRKWRKRETWQLKDAARDMFKDLAYAKVSVNDYSAVGGGVQYPLNLNVSGENLEELDKYSQVVMQELRNIKDLSDITADFQTGKPEFQVQLDPERMQQVGVGPSAAGNELRLHIAGGVVGKFYDGGLEYDIRMRLKENQRDLKTSFSESYVPNLSQPSRPIPLKILGKGEVKSGPSNISRQDRARVIKIHANLAPGGAIGNAVDEAKKLLDTKIKPPPGVRYIFWGQAEDLKELMENIMLAFGLALLFIYLVLASLYESFITPVTILTAIIPAISGAFLSLAIFREQLNIFSMIGLIMLMGLVTKNSILLVDYALQRVRRGMSLNDAIFEAGKARLRPILMTSFAMIAGTLPLALGLGEAAKQRTAMGIAIIGGLVFSTIMTLFFVPAIFGYVDRLREWIEKRFRPDYDMTLVGAHGHDAHISQPSATAGVAASEAESTKSRRNKKAK
ncbi:MAG: efflux RND transporter permease subunit [Leptospiraceae bacterium]|nr:efflux RND transporter permease subunit [Leptospiraceae bacterium]